MKSVFRGCMWAVFWRDGRLHCGGRLHDSSVANLDQHVCKCVCGAQIPTARDLVGPLRTA